MQFLFFIFLLAWVGRTSCDSQSLSSLEVRDGRKRVSVLKGVGPGIIPQV